MAEFAMPGRLSLSRDQRSVLMNLTVVYLRYGRWGDAVALLELADFDAPGDPRIMGMLAFAYLGDGQFRKSVEAVDRYLSSGPPPGQVRGARLIRARAVRAIEEATGRETAGGRPAGRGPEEKGDER